MNLQDLLNCRRLPARLTLQETAFLLGFLLYECGILVRYGALRPLGKPAANGHKYFSAVQVEALAKDHAWLDKATRIVSKAIQDKNGNSKKSLHKLAA